MIDKPLQPEREGEADGLLRRHHFCACAWVCARQRWQTLTRFIRFWLTEALCGIVPFLTPGALQ